MSGTHKAKGVRHLLAIAAMALSALSLTAPSANANTYGPAGGAFRYPDNSLHTFSYIDLEPASNSAANWARVESVGLRTDMTEQYIEIPTSTTDVLVYDGYYGGTWRAKYTCNDPNTAGECEQATVELNLSVLGSQSQNNRTKSACLEFGHTIGLGHSGSADSCMILGVSETITFNSHDVFDHINLRY